MANLMLTHLMLSHQPVQHHLHAAALRRAVPHAMLFSENCSHRFENDVPYDSRKQNAGRDAMDVDRFKKLVARLEEESAADPRLYRLKVAALTLLGFGILALLIGAVGFGLVLILGLCVAVAASGGGALLLLLKFGKLVFLLVIPLWFLVKSAVKALFIRLPAPQGREITRLEAPALFAALDRMRHQMNGPRFHHVLVVDDVNAAVVQRPAFGLVGWPRNYLLLGLPLLEAMPPEEALAVVAHEYGHLAGSHGHFSAFIYRLRHTWATVQDYTDHIQGWLGRLVAPLVRWYAPYFNAYTFVLARADEYHADAASAELVGTAHAAHALKRVNLVAPLHQRFMQKTFDRIDHEAQPPQDLMHRWAAQATQATADAERVAGWMTPWTGRAMSPTAIRRFVCDWRPCRTTARHCTSRHRQWPASRPLACGSARWQTRCERSSRLAGPIK